MTRRARRKSISPRGQHYRQLRHPFAPQNYFSEDHIQAIHDHALSLLETKGIKILLPEARDIFAAAGARVDDDMVFIGRDIVSAAIASAPKSFVIKGGSIERDQTYELGAQIFGPAGGCPNANVPFVGVVLGMQWPLSKPRNYNIISMRFICWAHRRNPKIYQPTNAIIS